jgi:MFS family permease
VSEQVSAQYRVYGYRWMVLAVFMLVNLTMQMLWIAYAPITSMASDYYGVSELWIGLLAMSFMIAFIPLSLPASWLIDTRGFRTAVGLGVVLMSVFGIARGLAGSNYALVLLSTIGIAVGQPFLLNSWTTVSANWFPAGQRATAVGLITLANLVGTAIGMVLTPLLVDTMSIAAVQVAYGVAAAASAAAFLGLARERPVTPPCPPGMEGRALMLDGLKHAFRVKPFLVYLGVVFVGMGVYNGVTTWVEQIVHPRGFSATDAGLIGALMLGGGLIGAVVVSALSDRQQKRVRFLVLGLVLAVPGLLGVAFFSTPWLLFTAAFLLGFFLVPVMPIGMQYAAEVTYPTPEGTSNGLIQLFGQVSVVFVYIMAALRTSDGSFTMSLLLASGLLIAVAIAMSRLKDAAPAKEPDAGAASAAALAGESTVA